MIMASKWQSSLLSQRTNITSIITITLQIIQMKLVFQNLQSLWRRLSKPICQTRAVTMLMQIEEVVKILFPLSESQSSFKEYVLSTYNPSSLLPLPIIFLLLKSWIIKWLGSKCTMNFELVVKAATEIKLNLKSGMKSTSLRIKSTLSWTSPHILTRIWTLFGRVIKEFHIGFKDTKTLAFEKIFLDASKSIIHSLKDELIELSIGKNKYLENEKKKELLVHLSWLRITNDWTTWSLNIDID